MEFFVLEYNERSKVNYNYFAVTDLSNALGQTCIYSEAKKFNTVSEANKFAADHGLLDRVHPQRVILQVVYYWMRTYNWYRNTTKKVVLQCKFDSYIIRLVYLRWYQL